MSKKLFDLVPSEGQEAMERRGEDFIKNFGEDVVKEVITNVFCGKNLRNTTEMLTRQRLAIANGSLILFYLNGLNKNGDFIDEAMERSISEIKSSPGKYEEWLCQWVVGLTNKGQQNILRDDPSQLDEYVEDVNEVLEETTQSLEQEYGEVSATLAYNGENHELGMEELLSVMMAVGAQTLTIRGSEKSAYGKLFEDLILGSLLSILGFNYTDKDDYSGDTENVFWFKSTGTDRESDATIITKPGKGARFDIGFIGRGNTEISLDKVSRYRREQDIAGETSYLPTFVIVDRIGSQSDIEKMATQIDGEIVQMSMSYWPKQVAQKLEEKIGYNSDIKNIPETDVEEEMEKRMESVNVKNFL